MKPIPSITELYNNLKADLTQKLGLVISGILKFVVNALAAVLAGMFKLVYLYLQDIQNNIFADTADTAENGGTLNRQGQIRLGRQPFPPIDGVYTTAVTGLSGSNMRAQLTFKSNDTSKSPGNLYILDNAYTLPGTTGVIALRSLNAGSDYALNIGDGLTCTEPLIGVNQLVIITGITQAPTAGESTELYRKKLLNSYRLEPQGGSKTDYRVWAADAPGVERVYPYVKNGDAGVVQVFVEATIADSTDGRGTPGTPLLDEVEAVIEYDPINARARRPTQAIMEINPVSIKPVDVQIIGLQVDNGGIRSSITANLEDYLFDVRPYIAGADLSRDKNDILTAVKMQSVVTDTIGNANSFLNFNLYVDGVQVNTYTFSLGNIPYLRNVTYS